MQFEGFLIVMGFMTIGIIGGLISLIESPKLIAMADRALGRGNKNGDDK